MQAVTRRDERHTETLGQFVDGDLLALANQLADQTAPRFDKQGRVINGGRRRHSLIGHGHFGRAEG
ncbi:hypothetical protein P350_35150 [Burkholderia cepacia JBK9]|nr:hypothetical protein P350_35150 [Burkholderia cepacia JBK9]